MERRKKKRIVYVAGLFFLLLNLIYPTGIWSQDSSDSVEGALSEPGSRFKLFLSSEQMEKVGLFQADNGNIVMTMDRDHCYLLGKKERLLLKTTRDGVPLIKFQAQEGQGPAEMIDPKGVGLLGDHLVVQDITKNRILFFSKNLEYIKESSIPAGVERILPTPSNKWLAWHNSENGLLSVFDSIFQVLTQFGEYRPNAPFQRIHPHSLKRVYLSPICAITTNWIYYDRTCQANVFFLEGNPKPVPLSWDNHFTMNQTDVDKRRNMTESLFMIPIGQRIVGSFLLHRRLGTDVDREIIVFNNEGSLTLRKKVDFELVHLSSYAQETSIFIINDESLMVHIK